MNIDWEEGLVEATKSMLREASYNHGKEHNIFTQAEYVITMLQSRVEEQERVISHISDVLENGTERIEDIVDRL